MEERRQITLDELIKVIRNKSELTDNFEVKSSTVLYDELGLDSLDVVELVMEVEYEFNVQVNDQNIERVRTVGELLSGINK
ncbi:MAG: acyl carrier protein [Bacteroidetes bacterium]|nr:acyl carrier protein [Bacteroidota bacterium]